MSQLVLVRHGQAAAFTEDSDRLTELGERQASVLGEYWAKSGVTFDEVVVGSLRRHAQTEAKVAEAYQRAGLPWPEAKRDAGWNEYDASGIMQLGAAVAQRDAGFAKLVADFQEQRAGKDRNRYFQRMFEQLMTRWIAGDVHSEAVESFEVFHGRVAKAFDAVLEGEGSRRVVVFTSGGPIGASVQRALRSPKPVAIELNWRVVNGSLTEFTFGGGRLSLDCFNTTPHLVDAGLRSFR